MSYNQMEFLLQTEIDLNGKFKEFNDLLLYKIFIETRDGCYHAIFN